MAQVPCARSEGLVLVQPPTATMLIATNSAEFCVNLAGCWSHFCAAYTCAKQRHRNEMTPILAVKEILLMTPSPVLRLLKALPCLLSSFLLSVYWGSVVRVFIHFCLWGATLRWKPGTPLDLCQFLYGRNTHNRGWLKCVIVRLIASTAPRVHRWERGMMGKWCEDSSRDGW